MPQPSTPEKSPWDTPAHCHCLNHRPGPSAAELAAAKKKAFARAFEPLDSGESIRDLIRTATAAEEELVVEDVDPASPDGQVSYTSTMPCAFLFPHPPWVPPPTYPFLFLMSRWI